MFLKFKNFINEHLNPYQYDMIVEGGSFGHMYHPYEDTSLTFGDLKGMVIDCLSGNISKESIPTEKLDGQAIAVSWKDGHLIASRNKGDRKNFGKNSLSVQQVIDKFSGRGDISDAFSFAVQDLSSAISKINSKVRDEIFQNGKSFMHLELIYPPTSNVINYDSYSLIFHNTSTYDIDGNEIDSSVKAASELTKAIKEVNADIQKTFKIEPPRILKFSKNLDFQKDKEISINKISTIQKSEKLTDNHTLRDFISIKYSKLLKSKIKKYNLDINDDILDKLIDRLAFKNKSYNLRSIKKDLSNLDFYDWFISFEKGDSKEYYKNVISPIENVFLNVGVKVIRLMVNILALDPQGQISKIKDDLSSAIEAINKGGGEKDKTKLDFQLKKLNSIGGIKSVLPSEGVVFKYKNKTYKLTGAFAPINQILGIIKYMK